MSTDTGAPPVSDAELHMKRIQESRKFMGRALKIAEGDPSVYVSDIKRWALLLTGHIQDLHESIRTQSTAITRLEGEVARLREALGEIANWSVDDFWLSNMTHCRSGLEDAVETARKALEDESCAHNLTGLIRDEYGDAKADYCVQCGKRWPR